MATEVVIPRLGWSMEEGIFGEWLKASGEFVAKGDLVFTLEGDKAKHDIESMDSGILHIPADAPRPGENVQVGQVIGYLLEEGESQPLSTRSSAKERNAPLSTVVPSSIPASPPALTVRPAGPAARRLARNLGIDLDAVPSPDPTGRVVLEDIQRFVAGQRKVGSPQQQGYRHIASPRARRKAQELGIEINRISGSGRQGRIRERDVIASAATIGDSSTGESMPPTPGSYQPATKIRSTIARRMLAATQLTAPVTLTTKVDASKLVAYRENLKSTAKLSILPSYNDLLVKLVATTLATQPALNACWVREGIYYYVEINVAIAIDTKWGLVAPVIPRTANLSLQEITLISRNLIKQAQDGTLAQSQLEGGTFTVTNLGMYQIDYFTPILNQYQGAILGIGRIIREPVVRGDTIVIGHTLGLSLTFDHRVIDGAPAAIWLNSLSDRIQNTQFEGTN